MPAFAVKGNLIHKLQYNFPNKMDLINLVVCIFNSLFYSVARVFDVVWRIPKHRFLIWKIFLNHLAVKSKGMTILFFFILTWIYNFTFITAVNMY